MKHIRYALQVIANVLWVLGLLALVTMGQTVWQMVQSSHAKIQPKWSVLWLTIKPNNWGTATWTRNGRHVTKLLNLYYTPALQWQLMGIWLLAVTALGLVLLGLLSRLVRRMRQGEYFTAGNAHLLTLIARVLLGGLLGSLVMTMAEILLQGVITVDFVALLTAVGVVGGVYALRVWFNYGVALQQDQDAII